MTAFPNSADRVEVGLALAAERGLVRAKDLYDHGIAPITLTRLVRDGRLTRVARGVYALPEREFEGADALAVVSVKVKDCVVCLASALQLHGLSTWTSPDVWIAIARHRRPPNVDWPPVHVVYVPPRLLTIGVEVRRIGEIDVRVTSPARTVADVFKWRSAIGLDVALESLREYLRRHPKGRQDLREMAAACRVTNVLRPYLEAMS